jgi:hypothetical protein
VCGATCAIIYWTVRGVGVSIPTIDVSILTGTVVVVTVKILDVRQIPDGLTFGAEGDGFGPDALFVAAAEGAYADLIDGIGIQTV